MEIEKLFCGVAVIIDDQVSTEGSAIDSIKKIIQERNISVSTFNDIPSLSIIPSFSNVSFVILDWDFLNNTFELSQGERMTIPSELAEAKERELIDFISELLKKIFVPVFVFTEKDSDEIIGKLQEKELWNATRPNRIFVKRKTEVSTEDDLFNSIRQWMKEMPSVYVLKKLERVITEAKNNLFLEMYDYSSNWVKIIWDMIKLDSNEYSHEFGKFITRTLFNRVSEHEFDEGFFEIEKEISPEELSRVVECERYIKYDSQPNQAYTGDLFKVDDEYYLNIRAQCSISRASNGGIYNPELYCIKGKALNPEKVNIDEIRVTSDCEIIFNESKKVSFKELEAICSDEKKLKRLNKDFIEHRNGYFLHKGEILERKLDVILSCIANERIVKFGTDIILKKFDEIKDKRIGRVLPPYITRVQQKCAQNIVREGILPIPIELFTSDK